MNRGILIAAIATVGGILGAAMIGGRKKNESDSDFEHSEDDEGNDDMPTAPTGQLKPIAVGEATDPNVAPLLASIQAKMDLAGIRRIKAFDMLVMTKAPLTDGPDPDTDKTRPVAIPDPVLWDDMIAAWKVVDDVATSPDLIDIPLRFTGYRAPDYNKAVGGAKDSAHIRGTAVDVWLGNALLASKDSAKIGAARTALRMAYARRFVRGGHIFGFGVYTNDIHMDVDDPKRKVNGTWENAQTWIAKAKKSPGIS